MGVRFVFGIKSFQQALVNLPKTRMARVSLGAGTGEMHQGKAGKTFFFFLKYLFPASLLRGSRQHCLGFISKTIAPLAASSAAQAARNALLAPLPHLSPCRTSSSAPRVTCSTGVPASLVPVPPTPLHHLPTSLPAPPIPLLHQSSGSPEPLPHRFPCPSSAPVERRPT